jgi:hypothetical protein
MYVLSPSASLDHNAISQFIEYLPSQLKNRISLAICLDGMVDSSQSWKDGQTIKIYESSIPSGTKDRFIDKLQKVTEKVENSGVTSI